VFPIIDEYRPRLYILPNLKTLIWRCETPAGLERSLLFLNPTLEHLTIDIGSRVPNFEAFMAELPNRVKLTTLAVNSITPLPKNFAEAMKDQHSIEKLTLTVDGSLSSHMGKWMASLSKLRELRLDLTAQSMESIEGFFEETGLRSGCSTPSSMGGTDSGVFSGAEDMDLADFRKEMRRSALRVTGDYPTVASSHSSGAFDRLEEVHLTGATGTIAAFLKHLHSDITTLELAIDDPPSSAEWQDLFIVLSERFTESLRNLHIVASSATRPDLTRTLSRGEGPVSAKALSLQEFPFLPQLQKLEIDLPQSVIFGVTDVARLGSACPDLEVLKLCPSARFPSTNGPPQLTLESLAHLTSGCRRLHTLAVVVNALPGSDAVLGLRDFSSQSLVRLNVGHSWIKDPLHAAILLSHLAPRLSQLKFFHEATRPGYIPAHANAWQQAAGFLPHLQRLRDAERRASQDAVDRAVQQMALFRSHRASEPGYAPSLDSIIEEEPAPDEGHSLSDEDDAPILPQKVDKSVDATPIVFDQIVSASPDMVSEGTSATPELVDEAVSTICVMFEDRGTSPTAEAVSHAYQSVATSPIDETISLPVAPLPVIALDTATVTPEITSAPTSETPFDQAASEDNRSISQVCDTSPQRGAQTILEPPKSSSVRSGGLLSTARDALFTVPIYVSLVLINSSLAMMGAQHVRALGNEAQEIDEAESPRNSSRFALSRISPVCI
jgi:hypothetical protein